MATFEDYAKKYRTSRIERRDGILQNAFQTDGHTMPWGELPHREFPQAFHDIASDPDIRVVIMTETGADLLRPTRHSGGRTRTDSRCLGRAGPRGGVLMFLMRFTERAYVHYTEEDVKNSFRSAVRLTFS